MTNCITEIPKRQAKNSADILEENVGKISGGKLERT